MRAESRLFTQLNDVGEALLVSILPPGGIGRLQEMTSAQLEQILSIQDRLELRRGSFIRRDDATPEPFDLQAFRRELFPTIQA